MVRGFFLFFFLNLCQCTPARDLLLCETPQTHQTKHTPRPITSCQVNPSSHDQYYLLACLQSWGGCRVCTHQQEGPIMTGRTNWTQTPILTVACSMNIDSFILYYTDPMHLVNIKFYQLPWSLFDNSRTFLSICLQLSNIFYRSLTSLLKYF